MRCAKCGSEHITLDSFAGNALAVYQCHECGWRTAGSDPVVVDKDFSQRFFGRDLGKPRWNEFRKEVEALKQQKENLKCPWCGREIKSFHTMDYVDGQGWNEIGGIFKCRRCKARLQSDQGYNRQATYLELISPGKLYCKPMVIFTKSEQKGKKMSRADNREIEEKVATQVEIAELKNQLRIQSQAYDNEARKIELDNKAVVARLNWQLENAETDMVAKLRSDIHKAEIENAVLATENKSLKDMVDLNGDVIDVKELVSTLINKMPEFKISNLTITPSAVQDK